MIIRDYQSLYIPLERARVLLKNCHDEEEKVALSNYIGNLYNAMRCMGDLSVPDEFSKTFHVKRGYRRFLSNLDVYNRQLLDNYILCKDFHQDFIGEILPEVEENVVELTKQKPVDDIQMSHRDFFDIIYLILDSIGLSEKFDDFYKRGHVYSNPTSNSDNNLGFTLYNPVSHDCDLFVRDFNYSFRDMSTLLHEFGHGIDCQHFDGSVKDYNSYFYLSFFGESFSRMMERLLHRFCIKNQIMVDLVKDSYINFEDLNHDYLLSSYVLSLLDEAFLRSGGHMVAGSDVIAKKVRKYFVDEETIKEFLKENDNLDLSENYTYAYGDIISMFLADEVEKYGFSSELVQYFLEKRKDLFSEEFMRECGFGPENYLKLYRKEVELIKK